MTCGMRSSYQAGCRCVPCRAAEAIYRAKLRKRKAKGLPLLGALISPVEARRRIRQLKGEGYTKARIADMAGWKNRHVQLGRQQRLRLATVLRIREIAKFAMLEGDGLDVDGDVALTPQQADAALEILNGLGRPWGV